MGLRVRFQHPTGASLGYSIERLADGAVFDFTDSTFRPVPATPVAPLAEDAPPFSGRYRVTLSQTPGAEFSDGNYAIAIHDRSRQDLVVAMLGMTMRMGDDATAFPEPAPDPWSIVLTGAYPPGTAGSILGQNLDARVSTRSTFDGGSVVSVREPVTVGVVRDKSGYSLSGTGLDAVVVEAGINARQALAPILAASAGVLSGAGTGTIVIRSADGSTSRITATTDNAGNRSAVVLSLPA